MRISDWSSDVCSSDLDRLARRDVDRADAAIGRLLAQQAGEGQAPAGVDVDRIGRAGLRIARALGAADLAAGLVALRPALPVRLVARRSEEHTSEFQSLMRLSYSVFCLTQKTKSIT